MIKGFTLKPREPVVWVGSISTVGLVHTWDFTISQRQLTDTV